MRTSCTKPLLASFLLLVSLVCAHAGMTDIAPERRWTVQAFGGEFGLAQFRITLSPEDGSHSDIFTVVCFGRANVQFDGISAPTVAIIAFSVVCLFTIALFVIYRTRPPEELAIQVAD